MKRTEEIRDECLVQLFGSQRIAISAAYVRKQAVRAGFDYTSEEVKNALYFLEGQEMCSQLVDPATGEVRFRITSKGILHWEHNHE